MHPTEKLINIRIQTSGIAACSFLHCLHIRSVTCVTMLSVCSTRRDHTRRRTKGSMSELEAYLQQNERGSFYDKRCNVVLIQAPPCRVSTDLQTGSQQAEHSPQNEQSHLICTTFVRTPDPVLAWSRSCCSSIWQIHRPCDRTDGTT